MSTTPQPIIVVQGSTALTNSLASDSALGYDPDVNDGSQWSNTLEALDPTVAPEGGTGSEYQSVTDPSQLYSTSSSVTSTTGTSGATSTISTGTLLGGGAILLLLLLLMAKK